MKKVIFLALFISSNLAYAKCSEEYINKAYLTASEVQEDSKYTIVKEIPISIVIAQNILETRCGKSNNARNRNNYYGLLGKNGKYLEFDDFEHSTIVYFNTLAKHRAYSKFRNSILQDEPLVNMVKHLSRGYAKDPKYYQKVIGVIETYNLDSLE